MSGISDFFRQKTAATGAPKGPDAKGASTQSRGISDIKIKESTFGKYQKGYNRLDMNSSIFGATAMDAEKPVIESEGASAYGNQYFNGNKPVQNSMGLVNQMQMANDFKENQAQSLPPSQPPQGEPPQQGAQPQNSQHQGALAQQSPPPQQGTPPQGQPAESNPFTKQDTQMVSSSNNFKENQQSMMPPPTNEKMGASSNPFG